MISPTGGHIAGVVTQWHPPKKLVYTWNVFDPGDPPDAVSAYPESYPTFELEAAGREVQLTFTHFPALPRFEAQNAMGWHTMLDILEAGLRGETVLERPHYMKKNATLYGVDLNNLAR
ncbi:MAG TPA: SRPBCC domain-containing protein [Polyangiaceae bacterium]